MVERGALIGKVVEIFPANSFAVVADNAKKEIKCGIIIGYDENGALKVFGGGLIDGNQPLAKDWLWIIESFKAKLINGDYA